MKLTNNSDSGMSYAVKRRAAETHTDIICDMMILKSGENAITFCEYGSAFRTVILKTALFNINRLKNRSQYQKHQLHSDAVMLFPK